MGSACCCITVDKTKKNPKPCGGKIVVLRRDDGLAGGAALLEEGGERAAIVDVAIGRADRKLDERAGQRVDQLHAADADASSRRRRALRRSRERLGGV